MTEEHWSCKWNGNIKAVQKLITCVLIAGGKKSRDENDDSKVKNGSKIRQSRFWVLHVREQISKWQAWAWWETFYSKIYLCLGESNLLKNWGNLDVLFFCSNATRLTIKNCCYSMVTELAYLNNSFSRMHHGLKIGSIISGSFLGPFAKHDFEIREN